MTALEEFDRLRDEGGAKLSMIAREWGDASEFCRRCVELWQRRVTEAFVSLSHRDVENARAHLERGLHVLTFGPEVARRERLALDEVVTLMNAL